MQLRARTRPHARRAAVSAALGALLVSAAAGTATADAAKRKAAKHPVITSVRPLQAAVGDTLTIRGRHFKPGRNKNTVLFKRDRGRAVFVKAQVSTKKLMRVTMPDRLDGSLLTLNGAPVPTRFRLRVLANRLGKAFTKPSLSPLVGPSPARPIPGAAPGGSGVPGTPPPAQPDGDCDGDGLVNRFEADDDDDLLADSVEASLKLDGCKPDTDGDLVPDGYEHRSAQDLNDDEHQDPNASVPHPDARPYPNALDADAGLDHDGDTLTLLEEHRLWAFTLGSRKATVADLATPSYPAGEQYSVFRRQSGGRRTPDLAAAGYAKQAEFLGWAAAADYDQVALSALADEWYEPRGSYDIRDFNRSGGAASSSPEGFADTAEVSYYDANDDGWLSDAERDEDADGLTNFDETRGCGVRSYWDKLYDKETPYYLKTYGTLRHDDPDSDGDGIRDGADDQDHDDVPNVMECSRNMASGDVQDPRPSSADPPSHPAVSFVNPFNPCLPHVRSRTCNRVPALDSPWAPFNSGDKYFYVWN